MRRGGISTDSCLGGGEAITSLLRAVSVREMGRPTNSVFEEEFVPQRELVLPRPSILKLCLLTGIRARERGRVETRSRLYGQRAPPRASEIRKLKKGLDIPLHALYHRSVASPPVDQSLALFQELFNLGGQLGQIAFQDSHTT